MTEEEKQRPMTALTLLTFLPTWFKFYVVSVRQLLACHAATTTRSGMHISQGRWKDRSHFCCCVDPWAHPVRVVLYLDRLEAGRLPAAQEGRDRR